MSDMVSRQAVLKLLSTMPPEEAMTKAMLIQSVKQMDAAQPEPRWISCGERLPEKNCRCLTTNTAWGAFEVDWNAWINGEWLYQNEKPIAWMPLPEPYKGVE